MNEQDDQESRAMTEETKLKALQVTAEDFVNYMNSFGEAIRCSYCGTGDYGVAPDPAGKGTAMVATPVPNFKGVGVWFYPATCQSCGHTIFFSASFVSRQIFKD